MKIINNVIFILFLQSGGTPLHEAASQSLNEEVVEILVKAGAFVNVVDEVSGLQHHSVPTDKYFSRTNSTKDILAIRLM